MSSDPPPSTSNPSSILGGGESAQLPSSSSTSSMTQDSLGLGLPSGSSTSTLPTTNSVLNVHPHLGHYIFNLLASIQQSPPRTSTSQHPLSVSSSGESDGSDEDDGEFPVSAQSSARPSLEVNGGGERKTPFRNGASKVDREALVKKIVDLLDNEEEEAVKDLLKPHMGDLAKDDILMDQVCLDCMHRRKDDVEQLPYTPHITPARARTPAVPSHPLRPYTPTRVPSFRSSTPLGRPQSPSIPPIASGARTPTLPHGSSALGRIDISPKPVPAAPASSSGYSSSGSPVAAPAMLNAKAATFNPGGKSSFVPASASAATFNPADPWKDAPPAEPPRSASPFGRTSAPGMTRTSSNLAIAAPLFSDQSSPFHSPMGTPSRAPTKLPDVFSSPALSHPQPIRKGIIPDDDEDDEFSPFGTGLPKLHHHDATALNTGAKVFEPNSGNNGSGGNGDMLFGSLSSESSRSFDSRASGDSASGASGGQEMSAEEYGEMAGGMTPLDVLHSVFASLPRVELEDALTRSGYDFEGAMAILVAGHTLPRSGSSTPQRVASPRPLFNVQSRATLNHHAPPGGYFQQGGRGYSGNMSPGIPAGRSPGGPATRMCRYYLAGECRRSDCRFSHDLDRALCRFWLRGNCAKGTNCEFLHQFPTNFDPHALSSAISRLELSSDDSAYSHSPQHTPQEEFPDLGLGRRSGATARFDPSRNRFANAVKRLPPASLNLPSVQITGARYPSNSSSSYTTRNDSVPASTSAAPVPRPSNRIKLRAPTLLPTLRTGASANEQYLSSRSSAIRLGYARNACLARAADAFRRGDGAAAKRFSREGKILNERMMNEANDAANILVRERRQEAQKAIRERDPNWSDDPQDRGVRGKECAGGLGVIMGVASRRNVPGGENLSADERVECLLDLHTLHGNEGAEVLGQFLNELEKEHFRGLAYVVVGEGKHVGTQDPLRGASKVRLAGSIKQYLAEWGYAWSDIAGIICVDSCRY